jgi:fibronectin-binding autotransporter adhesin
MVARSFHLTSKTVKKSSLALAAGLTLTASAAVTDAATVTWNNTSTNFNATGSWTGGSPAAGIAVFSGAANPSYEPNVTANISISQLQFGNSTTDGAASGYTLTGAAGTVLTVNRISGYNTSGNNTISENLTLGGSANTTILLTQATGGDLIITGNIGQAAANEGLSLNRVATSTPFYFTLSGNNTFSGGISFTNNGATLNINSPNAIGTGALIIGTTVSATIDNTSGAPVTVTNATAMQFSGTGTGLTFNGTNNLTFTGAISLTGASRTFQINGSTLELDGNITEDANRSITKTGAGRLVLGGTDNYSGGTTVSQGAYTVNGSLTGAGAVNVTESGTNGTAILAGTGGTIAGATTITANTGTSRTNELAPGDGITSGTIGHLTFGNALTINGTTVLDLSKSGSTLTNDEILMSGNTLTFGSGNLLSLNFEGDAPANGDTWTLFSGFSTRVGSLQTTPTVTGLPSGDSYSINYLPTSITLTVTAPVALVPEPASLALLSLGGAMLLTRRKSR